MNGWVGVIMGGMDITVSVVVTDFAMRECALDSQANE